MKTITIIAALAMTVASACAWPDPLRPGVYDPPEQRATPAQVMERQRQYDMGRIAVRTYRSIKRIQREIEICQANIEAEKFWKTLTHPTAEERRLIQLQNDLQWWKDFLAQLAEVDRLTRP